MSFENLKDDFRGVNVVTTTPFSDDGDQILYDELRENVSFLVESGIDLIIPCGGTSEIANLTVEERCNVVEATVDAVGDDGSVIGGVEGNVRDAEYLIHEYEDIGVNGVLIRPAGHPACGPHQQALLEYYRSLASATDLGVMVYKQDPLATREMISELYELGNVVAVKYKGGVTDFTETKSVLPNDIVEDLVWVNGRAELRAISFGIEGSPSFTTSLCNFAPEACLSLFEAMENGDWARAREIRKVVRPYAELCNETGADNSIPGANRVAAVKFGQELAGLYGGPARAPVLSELSEEDKERAREYYERIQRHA